MEFVKDLDNADINNIYLFGTSFSGGHVITLSSKHPEIRAAIAQCPYTDTFASIFAVPFITQMKLFLTLCANCVTSLFGHTIMVKLADKPNKRALMVDRDYEKYFDMMTKDSKTFKNITPITTILEFVKYSPGKYAKNVKVPILYAICENDTVAPAKETLKYVKESEKGIIKKYHCGHFDIYSGEHFRKAIGDYIEFFKNNLHNQ